MQNYEHSKNYDSSKDFHSQWVNCQLSQKARAKASEKILAVASASNRGSAQQNCPLGALSGVRQVYIQTYRSSLWSTTISIVFSDSQTGDRPNESCTRLRFVFTLWGWVNVINWLYWILKYLHLFHTFVENSTMFRLDSFLLHWACHRQGEGQGNTRWSR